VSVREVQDCGGGAHTNSFAGSWRSGGAGAARHLLSPLFWTRATTTSVPNWCSALSEIYYVFKLSLCNISFGRIALIVIEYKNEWTFSLYINFKGTNHASFNVFLSDKESPEVKIISS
jgi:hypothetical protein